MRDLYRALYSALFVCGKLTTLNQVNSLEV